jgi:CCR4-NOT complex subunit CAF16
MVLAVHGLTFRYRPDLPPALVDVDLAVEQGSRCLLVGANGAGKSTLLKILGGRYMIAPAAVRVLGRAAFHDTSLVTEVALIEGNFPFDADVRVKTVVDHMPGVDPRRVAQLIDLLAIDVDWHMHRVSDGQRRRVQILLKIAQPRKVLLLDEMMTDLDVVGRSDLLAFLEQECTELGTTILYATHIFDALADWATHICFMARARIHRFDALGDVTELARLQEAGVMSPLHRLVDGWIRTVQGTARQR